MTERRIEYRQTKTHCDKGHVLDEDNIVWNRAHELKTGVVVYYPRCAKCLRERKLNRDRKAQRRLDPKFGRKEYQWRLAWQKKNPEKYAVHKAVSVALRAGKLERPDACERCGREGVPEASHDDYSKPFEVEWLCRKCHAAKDRRLGRNLQSSTRDGES